MGIIRNFLSVCILISLLLVGMNQVSAEDFYLGEYPDGKAAYFDDTSVRLENHYTNGYHEGDSYHCVVKAVDNASGQYDVIQYEFYLGQTASIYKNGERVYSTMRGPHDYLQNNPVEDKLLNYFSQKNREDWHKVPRQIR